MTATFIHLSSTMACWLKICLVISIMLLARDLGPLAHAQPQVPCYFIFGDSLFDNGNNNDLVTMAKVNFPPYGIDFPSGPTGRFTNGQNMADVIAENLGFENYIPPFATARSYEILAGVNYASGGAGIRDETGQQLGGRISLNKQLLNHQVTISHIALLLKSKDLAKEHLSECIYTVGMGNNDYINNYLMPQFYPTSRLYTPEQYATLLIDQYSQQIKTLYNYGARKVAVFGIGLIGCIPAEVAIYGTNGSACVDWINNYVQLFNGRLVSLIDDLNNHLTNAKFIYINTTGISSGDPSSIGITALNVPCCDVSTKFGKGQCIPLRVPCNNRATYVFWDAFHPTEIVNVITAGRAYTTLLPTDAYPIDIRRLAQLHL